VIPRSRRYAIGGAGLAVVLAAGLAFWSFRPSTVDGRGAGRGQSSSDAPGGTAWVPPGGSPSASVSASAPGPVAGSAVPAGSWWRPRAGLTWQWQLSGPLDRGVSAEVYDVDAVNTSAEDVAALHAAGRKVICYVDAGSYEPGRPDAGRFPAAVLGKELDGWPGERWLDVRRWDVLEPILAARFDTCRQKGFDAVEPDNVDGYQNESGFPLTASDQLVFNKRLADLAHKRGLAVGLKNDIDQVAELQPHFDFAVNEECMQYDECDPLRAFVAAGKPVFHVEYAQESGGFCPRAKALGFSSMRKRLDLDAWRESC
jgi:glycosyl hydrolase family 114